MLLQFFTLLDTAASSTDSTDQLAKPVSSEELASRFGILFKELYKLFLDIATPLMAVYSLFAIFLIIIGGFSKSSTLRKSGGFMLVMELGSIVLIYIMPLLIGFAKYIGIKMAG